MHTWAEYKTEMDKYVGCYSIRNSKYRKIYIASTARALGGSELFAKLIINYTRNVLNS